MKLISTDKLTPEQRQQLATATRKLRPDAKYRTKFARLARRRQIARVSPDRPSELQQLVTTANQVAARFNGSRSTCVLTSYALCEVLQRLGYTSRPLRIEAAVFPDDRKFCGTILGGWTGSRRSASPGKWWGHLAVVVKDDWLLDPTLDQANKKEWPRTMRVGVAVAHDGALLVSEDGNGTMWSVSYRGGP
jgi:hypothetical protein